MAFCVGSSCKIRRHNPAGDLLTFTAKVTRGSMRKTDGRFLVDVEQEARNQDGELSVVGTATALSCRLERGGGVA